MNVESILLELEEEEITTEINQINKRLQKARKTKEKTTIINKIIAIFPFIIIPLSIMLKERTGTDMMDMTYSIFGNVTNLTHTIIFSGITSLGVTTPLLLLNFLNIPKEEKQILEKKLEKLHSRKKIIENELENRENKKENKIKLSQNINTQDNIINCQKENKPCTIKYIDDNVFYEPSIVLYKRKQD